MEIDELTFGVARIKKEGCALHPDDCNPPLKYGSNAWIKQLEQYWEATGDSRAKRELHELYEDGKSKWQK